MATTDKLHGAPEYEHEIRYPPLRAVMLRFQIDPNTGTILLNGRDATHTTGEYNRDGRAYRGVTFNDKAIKAHRLIAAVVLGAWVDRARVIDHIDHNPENNAASNLEVVTPQENAKRARKPLVTVAWEEGAPWSPWEPPAPPEPTALQKRTEFRYDDQKHMHTKLAYAFSRLGNHPAPWLKRSWPDQAKINGIDLWDRFRVMCRMHVYNGDDYAARLAADRFIAAYIAEPEYRSAYKQAFSLWAENPKRPPKAVTRWFGYFWTIRHGK